MYARSLLLVVSCSLAARAALAQPAPEPAPPAEAPPAAEPAPAPEAAPDPGAAPIEGAPPPAEPDRQAPAAEQPPGGEGEPPEPKRVSVGKQGFFQPSALLQGWIWIRRSDEWDTTFRVRRAELKVKGEIVPDLLAYSVMIDPAKLLSFETEDVPVENQQPPPAGPDEVETVPVPQPPGDTSILQDFYVTLLTEYADVSIGQFKIPVSYEGFNSSSKLLLPERAAVSRAFGDRRDLGIRAEKQFEYFGYVAGVFNGEGPNRLDSNDQKDLALRLEAYPMDGLVLGVVGYASVGERDTEDTTKDRLEGDVKVEIADAIVQAEYIHAWNGAEGARTQGHGVYAAVGYTFLDRVQPLVRVGFLNLDFDEQGYDMIYELGANYFIEGHEAKLQASYSLTDPTGVAGDVSHAVILSAQVAF
jgi:hypothetical protein